MKTFSSKGNNTMQNPKELNIAEEVAQMNAAPLSLSDLAKEQPDGKALNRQLIKKKKVDYNLYHIYQAAQAMLDTCEPTIAEMFAYNEAGQIEFTEAATVLASTSKELNEALTTAMQLFSEVDGEPDRLRKGFIKDKVIMNRYSRRGAEYAQQFDELMDKLFNMSALLVTIQSGLSDIVFAHDAKEGEIVND